MELLNVDYSARSPACKVALNEALLATSNSCQGRLVLIQSWLVSPEIFSAIIPLFPQALSIVLLLCR